MTALPCSAGTGNGLLHPDELADWAGAEDGAVGVAPGDASDVPGGAAELAALTGLAAAAGRAGEVIPAA
jgi:hypothetical protein